MCITAGVCTRFCRFILDTNEPPSEVHGFEIFSKKKKKKEKSLAPLKPFYSAGRCAAFQRGVGGDNSWGAKPHADACFAVEKGMTFSFSIQKQNG